MVVDFYTRKVIEGQELSDLQDEEGSHWLVEEIVGVVCETLNALVEIDYNIEEAVILVPGPNGAVAIAAIDPESSDTENRALLSRGVRRLTTLIDNGIDGLDDPDAS